MTAAHSRHDAFETRVVRLMASKSEYEAEATWDEIKDGLDLSEDKEVQEWLGLQRMILTNNVAPYAQESLQRSAIQEFYILFEHACQYEDWLIDCKQRRVFKDPFIIQNVEMVLDLLEKTSAAEEGS